MGSLGSQSGDHAEPVDATNVERLEVVKGPATLLYGSNALWGRGGQRRHGPSRLPSPASRGPSRAGLQRGGVERGAGGEQCQRGVWAPQLASLDRGRRPEKRRLP